MMKTCNECGQLFTRIPGLKNVCSPCVDAHWHEMLFIEQADAECDRGRGTQVHEHGMTCAECYLVPSM